MLVSLDLFAGIGGLTHALRGLATPALYCETEPTRVATLKTLMAKGLVPTAPIHSDVRTLTRADVPGAIDLITGGWPCRGWSVLGKRQGFEHAQSALFFEFARIVNEINPRLIFQENVPAVMAALPTIAEALPDYDLVWMTMPAYAVGSPQTRLRWYCLGVRKDVHDLCLPSPPYERHTFSTADPVPRMCPTLQPTARLSMLGNSVVPDAARLAFLTLLTGCTRPPAELWGAPSYALARPARTGKQLGKDSSTRRFGSWMHGTFERIDIPASTVPPAPDHGLTLIPFAHPPPPTPKAPDEHIVHEPVPRRMWATPRGANLGASTVLTHRTCRDLYTQLRFERCTPDGLRAGNPNPEWVEHLMGYPRGWTEMMI